MERSLIKYNGLGTACRYEISVRVSKVAELFTQRISCVDYQVEIALQEADRVGYIPPLFLR